MLQGARSLAVAFSLLSAAAAGSPMEGADFVVDFRELAGKEVEVSDCFIAGTTSDFIRCQTPNGAADYTLETETMDKGDLRMVFRNCPTGSQKKASCHFSVTGVVRRSRMPSLDHAKLRASSVGSDR